MKTAFLIICVWICSVGQVQADTLYLKNGQEVEGIIVEQTESGVMLDLGFGTTEFSHAEIERLETSSSEDKQKIRETQKTAFQQTKQGSRHRVEFAPEKYKEVAMALDRLVHRRRVAVRAQASIERLKKELLKKNQEKEALDKQMAEASVALRALNRRTESAAYNKGVVSYNAFVASSKVSANEIKKLEFELRTFSEKIQLYARDFGLYEIRLKQVHKNEEGADYSEEEQLFFTAIKRKLSQMRLDFSSIDVAYKSQGSTGIVDVILNDRVPARLLVDTGATFVLLSQAVVTKLGANLDDAQEIHVKIADGTVVVGKKFMLDAVQVGEARAKNVQAVVLNKALHDDDDGLLGMSFLGKFSVQIDSTHNRMILKSFDPD